MDESLARFVALYQQLSRDELHRLPEVYANEVVFTDPAHRIEGLAALTDYFAVLYQRLAYCRFVITSQLLQGRQAWLGWTMTFSHPRLRGGAPVTVEGQPPRIRRGGQGVPASRLLRSGRHALRAVAADRPLVRTIKGRLGA